MSEATKKAMHRPEVRERHLAGLKKALEKHGVRFKGGNGQEPVIAVKKMITVLEPLGFLRELPIKTKGHTSSEQKIPTHYKADFANPETKVVIEMDGPSHRNQRQQERDRKKSAVLENLGWKVIRIQHE